MLTTKQLNTGDNPAYAHECNDEDATKPVKSSRNNKKSSSEQVSAHTHEQILLKQLDCGGARTSVEEQKRADRSGSLSEQASVEVNQQLLQALRAEKTISMTYDLAERRSDGI